MRRAPNAGASGSSGGGAIGPKRNKRRRAPAAQVAQLKAIYNSGNFDRAISLAREILSSGRKNEEAMLALGAALVRRARFQEAERTLRELLAYRPANVPGILHLGMALQAQNRLDEAAEQFDRAVSLRPDSPDAASYKAELLILRRRIDEARRTLAPFLDSDPVHHLIAAAYARVCRSEERDAEAVPILMRSASDESTPASRRVTLYFALGEALDRSLRYDEAFEAFRTANELKRASFDARGHASMIDRMIEAWGRDAIEQLPRADASARAPVFIVGMPRSGTSLLERMLARLPGVVAGGELPTMGRIVHSLATQVGSAITTALLEPRVLTPFLCDRLAQRYLDSLPADAARTPCITDKMPFNFLHLGVISAILPGARIIHCRRDPIDTCLSCYFQNFGGAIDWAYNLDDIRAYHETYDRLMTHWAEVLDAPMTTLDYESLVARPRSEMERIAAFLELPFSDEALVPQPSDQITNTASSEQVRRPIYTSSVERWRNYERHLGPLIEAFGVCSGGDAR